MFLNAHLRLAIPAVLGDVQIFNKVEDPATRVPDIIAFQNDSDMDVTLHFDAGNNKAQVVSTVDGSGGYTTTSGAKTLKIAIDGETAVEFNLTVGAGRTIAQCITEINAALAGAGGNTAKARAVPNGTKYIAIVSGTVGQFSSVEILTPSGNSANALLGFAVGVGTNENSFVPDIVNAITIQAKGMSSFVNPRKSSPLLKIRGVVGNGSTGVNVMIDATTLFSYGGVQQ